jgi:anti-anti-sigma factor
VTSPSTTPLTARPVAGLLPGDHVCCTFGSPDEQQAIVGHHARNAINRGAQFFYFADRSDESTVRDYLDEAGVDAAAGLASGQIQIRRWFVPDGELDVEAMIASFEELKATTRQEGYSALVGASEMSWSLDSDADRVVQYERDVDRVFEAADVIGLCLYDRRLFSPERLAPLEAAHDYCVCTHGHGTIASRRRLTVTERDDLVLSLAGELDIDSAPLLAARLAGRRSRGDVVVETSELEFIDLAGCRLLVQMAEQLDGGHRVVLPSPSRSVWMVLRACGWHRHPRLAIA